MPQQKFCEENLDLRTNVFRANFEGPANILSEIANLFEKRSYGTIVGLALLLVKEEEQVTIFMALQKQALQLFYQA